MTGMRPEDLAQIRQLFLQEAEEGLAAMEQALVRLERTPDAREPLDDVFRIAHTLKGSAAISGMKRVSTYAHHFEDALGLMRDGTVTVTSVRITIMLQIVDAIRSMLSAEADGRPSTIRQADKALIGRLLPSEMRGDGDVESETPETDTPSEQTTVRAKARTLRVDMRTLDGMLTLSGEIAVAKGRMLRLLGLERPIDEIIPAAEELDRCLGSLHERVMQMRLVPLGPVFRQHQRTVRDIASAQGKLVALALEGEQVDVDASLVEHLRDPLTHLVRNAVDHGIESPAERRAAGKNDVGTITLHARHERGTVVVEARDDGRGLQRDRILATARARGIPVSDTMTESDVLALISTPGFSTADNVTEISGRGVGMDVVRRNLEAVRGTLDIESTAGAGTTVRIRLPLTVAIIDGFVVGVGDEHFVVPVDAVSECLAMPAGNAVRARGVLDVRGTALPYIRLRDVLAVQGAPPARESILVVQHAGKNAGLVVDHLLGETQAVLKPLHRVFHAVPGIAGTTIMGDGRPSLILDVAQLLQLAATTSSSNESCSPT